MKGDDVQDLAWLRLLTSAAGLTCSEAERVALLPLFRQRREMAAQLAALDLQSLPMAVTFSAAWPEAPIAPHTEDQEKDREQP